MAKNMFDFGSDDLAKAGILAMQSGLISPEDAAAHAEAAGLLPPGSANGQVQPSVMSMRNAGSNNVFDMNGGDLEKQLSQKAKADMIGKSLAMLADSHARSRGVAQNTAANYGDPMADLLKLKTGMKVNQQARAQMQQDRLDNSNHQRALQAVRSSPFLRSKLTQTNNLQNAFSNFYSSDVHTPEQFSELQQAIRANLGIKGQMTGAERERTQAKNLGLSWTSVQQFLGSKPVNVDQEAWVEHLKQLAGLEQKNVSEQYSKNLRAVVGGNSSMYDRRPDLKQDLDDFVSAFAGQVEPTISPSTGHTPAAPKKVSSDGMPATADIDAELAKRNKN